MLRIGRYINNYRTIMSRFKGSNSVAFNDLIKCFSDLSNGIYFLLDHILLLNKINIIKLSPQMNAKIDWYSNFAWGGECVPNLLYDVIDYYNNSKEINIVNYSLDKIENKESAGNYHYMIFK
jgi:hypothetical protein